MTDRRISLQTLIVLPFAAVIAATLAVHSVLGQRTLQRTADSSFLQINEQLAERVEARLDAVFDTPGQLVEETVGAIELGLLGFADNGRLERLLVNEVRAHPWVTNVALGGDDGRYVCAYRYWEDPDRIMLSIADGDARLENFDIDETGGRIGPVTVNEGFEVTSRPWYIAAIDQPGAVWFEPYTFFSGQSIGIGMSRSIVTPQGQRAVVAVDISLHGIAQFLDSLQLADRGVAFVMTPDGRLIADSSGRAPILETGGQTRLASASESGLDAVRRIETDLLAAGGNFEGTVEHADGVDVVHAQRYVRDGGLELIIGVSVPRSAYSAALTAESRRSLLVTLAVGLLGLAVVLVVARAITRPVRELTEAISGTEADRFPTYVPDSRIREIDSLSRSFSTMSNRLSAVMASLEQRVAERTGALEAANRQLQRLSRTDELTGLANRRRFARGLAREWQRASRGEHPLSVVMCDIDWFKPFNDDYGHPAGDRTLIEVANALKKRARRSGDLVARIGGEEFVYLLPDIDLEHARELAERARQDIEALDIEHRGSPLGHVTMSFGVTSLIPDATQPGADSTQLIAAADRALYRAKALGRNRVEVEADSDAPSEPESAETV